MKKISFIIHGKHRHSGKLISEIRQVFGTTYEVVFRFTEFPGQAIQLSKEEADSGSDAIIAVGGDGTLNETVNGIMQSANKMVQVGLFPCGTGNDYAKTIGAKEDILSLRNLIEANAVRKIDLGLVNFKTDKGADAARYFINITDVGMGGYIAQKIASYSKWLGATLTFQRAILTTFLSYKHAQVKMKAGDFTYEGKFLSLIIAKGKYFGSGLGIAPDAQPDNGIFSLVIGAEISLFDYLLNLGSVRKCRKINHPQMSYYSAKEVTIETPQGPMPIDMDGEFIGYTPMKVSVQPAALNFIG